MYVCMYVCMYVGMYVCMYVCMYACMYVCRYVCMYVCIYIYIHICVCAIELVIMPTKKSSPKPGTAAFWYQETVACGYLCSKESNTRNDKTRPFADPLTTFRGFVFAKSFLLPLKGPLNPRLPKCPAPPPPRTSRHISPSQTERDQDANQAAACRSRAGPWDPSPTPAAWSWRRNWVESSQQGLPSRIGLRDTLSLCSSLSLCLSRCASPLGNGNYMQL